MAYRRSIAARSNLFYHHRFSPSISHSHRHHDVSQNSEASPISRNPRVRNYIQHRFLGAGNNFSNCRRFAVPAGCGMVSSRNYSSEADKTEVVKEVDMTVGEYRVKRKALFKEYGASPLQHLKGLLISVSVRCSIFLAVSSMAAKDPSFKDGGALWFTDLANHYDDLLLWYTVFIYMIKMCVQEPNEDERKRMISFLGLH